MSSGRVFRSTLQSGSTEFQTPQSGIIRSTLQSRSTKFSTQPSEVLFSNLAIKKKKREKNITIRKFSKKKKFKPCHQEEQEKPTDTTKELMSSSKCRSVEVINNPARPGLNHREVNCINYK